MDYAKQLSDGRVDGVILGRDATDKISLYGATPVVQPSGAAQAAVATTGATNTTPYGFTTAAQADGLVALVNAIRSALVSQGIIKGGA
jgi:hypothetical protein